MTNLDRGPLTTGLASDRLGRDAAIMMRYDANKKSPAVAYLLWFFLGGFGAHRFYLGHTGSAVVMLIITLISLVLLLVLVGALGFIVIGIWLIVDAFLIPGMVRDANNDLVNTLTS